MFVRLLLILVQLDLGCSYSTIQDFLVVYPTWDNFGLMASTFGDPWLEKTSSFRTPTNHFHDMITPFGGSTFTLKPSPFKGITDFESTGRGGFHDFQGGHRNNKGEIDEYGQIVQSGQSGAAMKNYKLEMAELAQRHRERNPGKSSKKLSASRNLLDDRPAKKSRQLIDDSDFPDVAFADGRSTASVSIQDLGFDLTDMPQEKEMLTTKGFHTNGSIPGEMVRVVPVAGCDSPGEYDFVIASKQPFINGFDSNTDLFTMDIDRERQILNDNSSITYPRTNGLNFPMMNGEAGFPALPRRGFTIASFNYFLAGLQSYTKAPLDEAGDKIRTLDFKRHFRYIQAFAIHGIADSEKYSNNGSSFGMNTRRSDTLSSSSALNDKDLNIIYEGRAQIKNIFGPAPAGTHLWLIYKKIKRPEVYLTIKTTDPLQTIHNPGVSNAVKWDRTDLSERPFQLVPYADIENCYPPPSEVEFVSDHIKTPGTLKRKHMGICIYVGQVLKPQEAFSHNGRVDYITRKNTQTKAIFDITIGQQDLIEILVKVRTAGLGTLTRLPIFPIRNGTRTKKIAKLLMETGLEKPERTNKKNYDDYE